MVLDKSILEELKQVFEKNLKNTVEVILITDKEKNQEPSEISVELANDLISISDKIKFEIIDASEDKGKEYLDKYDLKLDKWGKRYGPIFFFKNNPNIIFYGIPVGHEFAVFIEDIIMLSNGNIELSPKAIDIIKNVKEPIDIYVFVTYTCPYCPLMTLTAHKFAYLNDNIRGIMIEATEFPEFASAFNVFAVPKNVIRHREKNKDLIIWEGMVPESTFAERIKEALNYV